AGLTRAPLRPRFAWERVASAARYEVQLDDGCAAGAPSACDFAAARVRTIVSTSSARADTPSWIFEPGEDLLLATATRGARVHWRVRACDAEGTCGAWSPEVRWLDVGRDRHDVDGDGRGDLLVGAPGTDRGAPDAGDVHLFRGTDAGFSATEAPLDVPATAAGAWLGSAIALGDLDGDGLADAVISASNAHPTGSGAGSLIVLRGSATSGLDTARPIMIAAPDAAYARYFGESVAIVDDADGDGFRDVLVGASRDGAAGRAYLFRGDAGAVLLASPAARYDDPDPGAGGRFGFTVAAAFDVDGDGRGDLLIGAPFASDAGGAERGRAWLVRASAPASPIALMGAADAEVFFGWSLAGVGDLDEDGYGDIAIGAPYEDLEVAADSDEGRVYVFAGGAAGVDPARVLAHIARSTGYDYVHAGWSLAAGDVDGDGHVDLVVPEPAIDVSSTGPIDRGLLAVHRGNGRGGFEPVATVLYPDDTQASMEYGRSVSVIDANGDGRAEVVGGAHRWNSTSDDAGRVWWHEDPFGADLRGEISAPTATGSAYFGWALPGSVGRYDTQLDTP
ncbi:MAG: FG-GAP-like repeat-containing protein, partial [Myxococcota bacterium]|nr:FG-GAP-like repeat-containing protein [Myxococcota bacterium]